MYATKINIPYGYVIYIYCIKEVKIHETLLSILNNTPRLEHWKFKIQNLSLSKATQAKSLWVCLTTIF